jgi:hypothetical protein
MLPIPQSQKNIVRLITLKAWRRSNREMASAESIAHNDMPRDVGACFLEPANELATNLLRHWDKNKIYEPAAVFVAGEPGCEGWDE